jgi:hypothetical protein
VVLSATMSIGAMPGGAVARDGDIIRTGGCTGASSWKLKLGPEDGRMEVEFEVDQNRNGSTWNVRLKRDGRQVLEGAEDDTGPKRVVRGAEGHLERARR